MANVDVKELTDAALKTATGNATRFAEITGGTPPVTTSYFGNIGTDGKFSVTHVRRGTGTPTALTPPQGFTLTDGKLDIELPANQAQRAAVDAALRTALSGAPGATPPAPRATQAPTTNPPEEPGIMGWLGKNWGIVAGIAGGGLIAFLGGGGMGSILLGLLAAVAIPVVLNLMNITGGTPNPNPVPSPRPTPSGTGPMPSGTTPALTQAVAQQRATALAAGMGNDWTVANPPPAGSISGRTVDISITNLTLQQQKLEINLHRAEVLADGKIVVRSIELRPADTHSHRRQPGVYHELNPPRTIDPSNAQQMSEFHTLVTGQIPAMTQQLATALATRAVTPTAQEPIATQAQQRANALVGNMGEGWRVIDAAGASNGQRVDIALTNPNYEREGIELNLHQAEIRSDGRIVVPTIELRPGMNHRTHPNRPGAPAHSGVYVQVPEYLQVIDPTNAQQVGNLHAFIMRQSDVMRTSLTAELVSRQPAAPLPPIPGFVTYGQPPQVRAASIPPFVAYGQPPQIPVSTSLPVAPPPRVIIPPAVDIARTDGMPPDPPGQTPTGPQGGQERTGP